MWFYKENFLDEVEFKKLSDKVKSYQSLSTNDNEVWETIDNHLDSEHGRYVKGNGERKVRRYKYTGDFYWYNIKANNVKFFGSEFKSPLQKMYSFLHEQGFDDVVLQNLWLQYTDHESIFHRHRDNGIANYKDFNCFTSILYTHDYWEESWGGSIKISDSSSDISIAELNENQVEYFPKPNTLIVWTRDHPHWMTPILNKDVTRMFVGGCWYRDESRRIHN